MAVFLTWQFLSSCTIGWLQVPWQSRSGKAKTWWLYPPLYTWFLPCISVHPSGCLCLSMGRTGLSTHLHTGAELYFKSEGELPFYMWLSVIHGYCDM